MMIHAVYRLCNRPGISSTQKQKISYDLYLQDPRRKKNCRSVGISDEAARIYDETCEQCSEPYEAEEGSNGGSCWEETAANAIRPLYQLIALSRMRSGGVWSEKS